MRIRQVGDAFVIKMLSYGDYVLELNAESGVLTMAISDGDDTYEHLFDREDCSELWTIFKRFADTGQLVDTEAK